MGDMSGLVEKVQELNIEKTTGLIKSLEQGMWSRGHAIARCTRSGSDRADRARAEGRTPGTFSLHDMYEQFQTVLNMGPISHVLGMMPGMNSELLKGNDGEVQKRLKRFMTIIESMTQEGPWVGPFAACAPLLGSSKERRVCARLDAPTLQR